MNYEQLKTVVLETVKAVRNAPYIMVGVSNRHIHLSQTDLELLFGAGYALRYTKELQPRQYACEETVDIIGKKGRLERVRVLGPVRGETQLEISMTDSFALGVRAPVNESGNLAGAAGVVIRNPQSGKEVERACAIVALRHIHMTPESAARFGLSDRQRVSVEFDSPRSLVLNGMLVRVSPDFRDEIHIDTDEGNAGGIKTGELGRILLP